MTTASAAVQARIRQIVRLAEHPTTGEGERAAAWNRAEALCAKHGLALDDFKTKEPSRPFDFAEFARDYERRYGFDPSSYERAREYGAPRSRTFYESTPGGRQGYWGFWCDDDPGPRASDFRASAGDAGPRQDGADADYWEEMAAKRDRETRRAARAKLDRAAAFLGAIPATAVGDHTGRWIIPGFGRFATPAELIERADRLGLNDRWDDVRQNTANLADEAARFLNAIPAAHTDLAGKYFFSGAPYSAEQIIVIALEAGWRR